MQKHYTGIWQYLRANRWWCLAAILLTAEVLLYACLHAQPSDAYQNYVTETIPLYPGMFSFIFIENTMAAVTFICWGIVPFGIGSSLYAYFMMSSLVSTAKRLLQTISGNTLFFCTLPHGLFEGTAVIFSAILSCLLSKAVTLAVIRLIRQQSVLPDLQSDLKHIGISILVLLIPALLLAAAIETGISSHIVRYLS